MPLETSKDISFPIQVFTNTLVKTLRVHPILLANPSNQNKTLVTFSKKVMKKKKMMMIRTKVRTRVQIMKRKKSWTVKILQEP